MTTTADSPAVENSEEVTEEEMTFIVDSEVEDQLQQDPIGNVTFSAIFDGIIKINEANKILIESDTGTKVSDIDKALKDVEKLPKAMQKPAKDLAALNEKMKKARTELRNNYRVNVLHEEPSTVPDDFDKEAVVDVRKMVMESLKFLETYAQTTKKPWISEWVAKVSVPQVGRQGSSTAGQKKPRVFVKIGDNVYDSFTLAAAGISTKDNKVTVAQMTEAWNAALNGTEGGFEFKVGDTVHEVVITNKPKKSGK